MIIGSSLGGGGGGGGGFETRCTWGGGGDNTHDRNYLFSDGNTAPENRRHSFWQQKVRR